MPGSPEHVPTDKTRAEVSALCAYGVPQEEIATYVGIDPKTLRKHYRDDLDSAKAKANAKVRKFLFEAATGEAMHTRGASFADCLRGSMFWGKTQMGMKETDHHEHTSPDGSMSPTRIEIVAPSDNSKDTASE